jgi:hypothetical protein
MRAVETPVSFAGKTLNVAAEFSVSRYWSPGALTVEAGCYELDGAEATAQVALANRPHRRVKPPVCELRGWRRCGGFRQWQADARPSVSEPWNHHLECHREAARPACISTRLVRHVARSRHGPRRALTRTTNGAFRPLPSAPFSRPNPDAWFVLTSGCPGRAGGSRRIPKKWASGRTARASRRRLPRALEARDGEDLRLADRPSATSPIRRPDRGLHGVQRYTAEWQMWGTWQPSRDDYSAPARKAFRAFLGAASARTRSCGPRGGNGAVTLAAAEIPRWNKRRPAGQRVSA